MKTRASLFSYQKKTSSIHKSPASFKLLMLIALSLSIFSTNLYGLIILSSTILSIGLLAKTSLLSYRRIIIFSLFYALFILLFSLGEPQDAQATHSLFFGLLSKERLYQQTLYLWRLFLALLVGTIFYETTTSLEIREAVEFFVGLPQRVFCPKKNASKTQKNLSLLFTLSLLFIPRIFSAWAALNRAWLARSGSKKTLGAALKRTISLVPALILYLLNEAQDTARALENRS